MYSAIPIHLWKLIIRNGSLSICGFFLFFTVIIFEAYQSIFRRTWILYFLRSCAEKSFCSDAEETTDNITIADIKIIITFLNIEALFLFTQYLSQG